MSESYAHCGQRIPEPRTFRLITSDMDHAQAVLDRFYNALTLEAPGGVKPFSMGATVIRLGPLTMGHLQCGGPVAMAAGHCLAYHVTIPLAGRMRLQQAGYDVTAHRSTAAVIRPGQAFSSLHDADSATLDVCVNGPALENQLADLLGRPIDGPLDLPPTMDLANGPGRSWYRLVTLLRNESDDEPGLLHYPLVAERLRQSLLTGLLLSLPHRYHEELTAPAQSAPPRALRRAIDAMHDEPERAFTVADLAAIAGMSVRSLQEGFRRHLGLTPMSCLQDVRLSRAHDQLCAAEPGQLTVAAVAHRWGFAHLGRFARAYRERYGRSPSETLRGPAPEPAR